MKSLYITEGQKQNLLEMCKTLFSNYAFKFINDDLLDYDDKSFNCISYERTDVGETDFEVIHWFEFCMTHLASKIIYPLYVPKNANSEEGLQIGMEIFGNAILYWPKTHPVDYLYEQFLKLK